MYRVQNMPHILYYDSNMNHSNPRVLTTSELSCWICENVTSHSVAGGPGFG